MNNARLRRAVLELVGAMIISVSGLFIFKSVLMLTVTFRQLLLLLMPGLTAYFAFRLRFPKGHWTRKVAFELVAFWLLLIIQGAILIWIPVLAPSISVRFFVAFMLIIVTLAFWLMRAGLRFWVFWNRRRQTYLIWALTHAHMMVALALVCLGFVAIVVLLAIFMPDRRTEPINQILTVLPFSILLISPSIIGLILLLGISAVFSYFVMRPTVRRLQNLVTTTEQLSSGNYAARSPVSGKDEVMRLQVNLNQMAAEMEHTVRDLRSERDAVSKLLQLRRELMTSVSHELRTPIATLRAYTEAMLTTQNSQGDALPETLIHDLQIVTGEVTRLQTLVDDLFTLARTETRQLPLHFEPTDVRALVKHVVEAVAPLAWNSYRVQVTAEMGVSPSLAKGDVIRIEQILRNLIQNSLQHTPPGGIITLEVDAECEWIRLHIEDTGSGIDPVDLPHIWERFYRGVHAQTGDGSGLGLALVKELTEAMGGHVEVSSVPQQGSRFTIVLPCA